jgi:hypothetical protein
MPGKKRPKLPEVGATFAVQLENGLYVVCRVVREVPRIEYEGRGFPRTIEVVCSAWYGDAIPDVNNRALRSIQKITSYDRNYFSVHWFYFEPPRKFKRIGTIIPTSRDFKKNYRGGHGIWSNIEIEMYEQWRWDHEREAVLAEIAAEEAKELRDEERERKRQTSITLNKLKKHLFFSGWGGIQPLRAIKASRQIMKETVKELTEIGGKRAGESERLAVLKKCIEAFNIMDKKYHHFIETVERENICQEFELLVYACGLGHRQNLADEWRDW